MKSRLILFSATIINLFLLIGIILYFNSSKKKNEYAYCMQYGTEVSTDLLELKNALFAFRTKYQFYPIEERWSGIYSFEISKELWISGLVPEFIDSLPREPRESSDGVYQYIYKSNGTDFKLINHSSFVVDQTYFHEDIQPDPIRPTFAVGIWSDGAANW